MAISPDGTSVYVAGGTLARFAANGPAGQIVFTGCLNNDGTNNCVDLPGDPLEGVNDVAVSPDGKSVYAVSFTGDAIGVLLRDAATGKLEWDGCLSDDGADNCVNLPGSPLDGALGVAVSGDGRSVYVASAVGDSLSHLTRDTATGGLASVGCVNNDGSGNCADAPGAPLDYAAKVAVSPDGRSVYAAAYESDAVTHAVRDPRTGRLSWGGSVDGTAAPLDGAQSITVSPDGKSVLVGTAFSSAVVRLARELPAPTVPKPPVARPDTTAPAISRLAVTGRRLRYTLSERAAVTINVASCRTACRVKRTLTRAGAAGSNRVRMKLRPGRYRARLVAADAAGNRSARAAVRFRVRRR